jgi:hypothetical protein
VVKIGAGAAAAGIIPISAGKTAYGPLTGIWHSRYEYPSSSRSGTFTGEHYVAVIHHGARLQIRSLTGSADSRVLMDLSVDGQVATGTWTEHTSSTGYYHGATYHGAIQLLIEPTARTMTGKWVGFGRDFDLNTGPWTLQFKTGTLTNASMDGYNHPPESAT